MMLLVAVCCCVRSPGASAVVVTPAAAVTITQTYAYTSYNGGDFVFSTSNNAPGCSSGWYVKATDPGFKAAVATILAAQAGGSYVIVYGDTADLWSGSPSGQYCRVQAIGIVS
jgi:hypothetical protein